MTRLELFLENAPKSLIHQVHQGINTEKSGLLSNSKILSTVVEKLIDKELFLARWDELNDSERKILTNIYFSGTRGLTLGDLTFCVSPAEQFLLKHTLKQLCWDLFIYRSEEDKNHFFGFEEYREWVLETIKFENSLSSAKPKNYQGRLDLHLFSVSSFLFINEIPVSQNGEVNKRFFNQMQGRLKQDHPLVEDTDCREEELTLLISFLSHKKLIQQSANLLTLNIEKFKTIKDNPSQLPSVWIKNALLHFDNLNISAIQKFLSSPVEIESFINFFSAFTKTQSTKFEHWHQLPRWVKLLWWAGIVNLNVEGDRVVSISSTKDIRPSEMPIYFLPNFEIHVPLNSGFDVSLLMEFAGELVREDQLCTYKITADSIHKLLSAYYSTADLKALFAQHTLPANVQEAIDQWIFTHEGAHLNSCLFLEIEDKETLKNISSLPQCKEWNLLQVEDKGLLVPHEYKSKVIEVMNTFGFHLKEVQVIHEGKDYFPPSIEIEAEIPSKLPNYIEKKPNPLNIHIGELGKYGGGLQELEFNERLRVIEYAILTDSRLELLTSSDRSPKLVLPKDLLRTDPISLIAKIFPSGESMTSAVEDIKKIRVVD